MADFLNKWREGLARTSKAAFGRLAGMLGATEITSETWDDLEALLIQADVGLETTQSVLKALKETVRREWVDARFRACGRFSKQNCAPA